MGHKTLVIVIRTTLIALILITVAGNLFAQQPVYRGRTLKEWQVDLRDLDPGMRISAIDAVSKFGKDSVPVIISMLSDKDARVRSSAAVALGNIGLEAKYAIPSLIETLSDGSMNVRNSVAVALDRIGPAREEAVPELIKLLGHKNYEVGYSAMIALANIEPEKTAAVPALIKSLSNKDNRVRASSAIALGYIGSGANEAIPTLIEVVGDEDGTVRDRAVEALFIIVRETRNAVKPLISALQHDNEWVRSWAALILVSLKPPIEHTVAENAVLILVDAFEKGSVIYEGREDIAEAIAESDIAQAAKKAAVPALIKALEDENKGVRREVAEALGSIGTEANDAVPMMITALGDESERVRKSAERTLEKIGPAREEAVPKLIKLLGHKNYEVGYSAMIALANIEPKKAAAVPALVKALSNKDKRVRAGSANALGNIGSGAEEAVPTLIEVVGDEDGTVRDRAGEALFEIVRKTRDELPAVIKAMEHDNEWVRLYAASILVALKPPVDDDVAEDAVLVLVGVFEKSSVIYKDRDEIAEAIAESDITPAAKKAAVPALTKALEDENKGVRHWVAVALSKIGIAIDIDGNVYQTEKIGNQWWMAENLKVTHYRNGDAILKITNNTTWRNSTSGAYCNPYNNADTYLYNWYSVNDIRNIAPEGWHVPSDEEWQTLVDYLGGSDIAGGKMKETGTTHWRSPNTFATNESGFSALPGGFRDYDGYYRNMDSRAYFWSSTESSSSRVFYRKLYCDRSEITHSYISKHIGFSIRCVRD